VSNQKMRLILLLHFFQIYEVKKYFFPLKLSHNFGTLLFQLPKF